MSSRARRDWRLYADDIVRACEKIRVFTDGMSFESFLRDERTQDAVIRNLEIIGEAARHLPVRVTSHEPHIPWRLVCDMRNVLAHAYFGVSLQVVWDAATNQVAALGTAVRRRLADADDEGAPS